MNIVSLGNNSWKLSYPLLGSLFHFLSSVGKAQLNKKINGIKGFAKHQFVFYWFMYLSQSLIFVLYCIEKKKVSPLRDFPLKHNTNVVFSTLLIMFYFVIDFTTAILISFINIDDHGVNSVLFTLISIIGMSIFSIIILKYKYYRHHFFWNCDNFCGVLYQYFCIKN